MNPSATWKAVSHAAWLPCKYTVGSSRRAVRDLRSVRKSGSVAARRGAVSGAEGEQSEVVTDNIPELTGEVVALPRSVLFACDDSEECEKGAELLFDTMVKEGDTVHFVHVLCDDRDYSTNVAQFHTVSSTPPPKVGSGTEEYRSHLESSAAEMMKRRYGRFTDENIRTQFHLSIINGPNSSSEIGSAICNMALGLNIDAVVIVTPHRGTLTEFGSVGHHCYHHIQVPMLAVPIRSLPAKGTMHKTVLVIAKDSDEVNGIRSWMEGWSHIFKDMDLEILNLQETHLDHINLDVLCTKMQMTFPKVIIMRSQADASIEEEILNPSLAPGFCSKSISPVLILPHQRARSKDASSAIAQWSLMANIINLPHPSELTQGA